MQPNNEIIANVALFRHAVDHGDLESVRRLVLEEGVDVNTIVRNDYKSRALHISVEHGHWEMVKFLLKETDAPKMIDDTDSLKRTPFLLLMQQYDRYCDSHDVQELIQLFLELGADIHAKLGRFTDTPLSYACRYGTVDTVNLLLVGGGKVSQHFCTGSRSVYDFYAHSIMTVATQNVRHGFEIILVLVGLGVSVTTGDRKGRTLLHSAAYHGNARCTQLLIDKGLDVNEIYREDKLSPLQSAFVGTPDHDTIRILLSSGAKLNVQDQRFRTPFHRALDHLESNPSPKIIRLLVSHALSRPEQHHGISLVTLLTWTDEDGQTAFHYACDRDSAQALLEHTTDDDTDILPWCHDVLFAKDRQGRTLLQDLEERRIMSPNDDLRALLVYLQSFTDESLSTGIPVTAHAAAAVVVEEGVETNIIPFNFNPRLNDFQTILATHCLSNLSTSTSWSEDSLLEGSRKEGAAAATPLQENIIYGKNLPEIVCHVIMGYLAPADVMKRTATNPKKR